MILCFYLFFFVIPVTKESRLRVSRVSRFESFSSFSHVQFSLTMIYITPDVTIIFVSSLNSFDFIITFLPIKIHNFRILRFLRFTVYSMIMMYLNEFCFCFRWWNTNVTAIRSCHLRIDISQGRWKGMNPQKRTLACVFTTELKTIHIITHGGCTVL